MTLRRKILILISFLMFLIILAMSGTYYYLFTRQIEEHSRSQVTLAFELVFDDLETRVRDFTAKIDRFVLSSLVGPMYVSQLFQDQYRDLEKAWTARDVRKIMTHLGTIANDMSQFGDLIDAAEILIYDKGQNLLAVYQHQGEEKVAGVYLPLVFDEELIPIQDGDDWYVTLMSLEEVPRQTFPGEIATTYQEEVPDVTVVTLSTLHETVTMKFIVPILQRNEFGGVCVLQVDLKQNDVERYSRLSKTKLNVFAGTTWSVGVLPAYRVIPEDMLKVRHSIDLLNLPDSPSVEFSEVEIGGQDYYQGTMVLGDVQNLIGTITSHFPRSLEEQGRKEFMTLVAIITLLFGILTAGGALVLSAIIVRPIMKLTLLLQKLTQGDLRGIEELLSNMSERFEKSPGEMNGHQSKDELVLLFQSFRAMVQYLHDMAIVADHISRGNITHEITPRSEDDVLGNAFHRMTAYLKEMGEVAECVAQGDLRGRITRRSQSDQLGSAFIHMQEGLISLISKMRSGADYTASISTQVLSASSKNSDTLGHIGHTAEVTSSAMQEVKASAEEARMNTAHLTSSVEETTASISQMISSIKQVAENSRKLSLFADNTAKTVVDIVSSLEKVADQAEHSKTLSETTTQDAVFGQASVDQVINSINTISEVTEHISDIILRLESRSVEIGTILDVINAVADQTSLLSLNASIIAAQAGTQGRAFSVVADEIKELATRVGISTKEIAKIIQAVQRDSSDAVHAIEQGQREVKNGVAVAHNAEEALNKIGQSVGNSSEVAAEMAESIRRQTITHTHIVESIKGVTNMINEITQATQEQEKNSSQLFIVVENMQSLASQVLTAMQEQQQNTQHVTNFMEDVTTLVQENRQTVQQLAQSSNELASQAELLKNQVKRFILPESTPIH